jgi:hypothetical protein
MRCPHSRLEEKTSMDCGFSTLLDILSSEQFRTVILFTLGLDTCHIADLLETSERTVCNSLGQCFAQVGCRSVDGLTQRLLHEWENDLYDERLERELAKLQSAARRMLEKIASPSGSGTIVGSRALPSAKWVN